jgi:gliding motility-associated-like protein
MVFVSKTGKGTLESPFEWQTTCDAVKEERTEYLIDFITRDQGLCERKADTATVKLVLIDPDVVLEEFLPANAFTPDGDTQRKNEYFSMPDLPEENCRYQFIKIEIFNRWGGKVYESADRNFEWNGSDLPASTYYYRIDFKKKIYKGTVSILK